MMHILQAVDAESTESEAGEYAETDAAADAGAPHCRSVQLLDNCDTLLITLIAVHVHGHIRGCRDNARAVHRSHGWWWYVVDDLLTWDLLIWCALRIWSLWIRSWHGRWWLGVGLLLERRVGRLLGRIGRLLRSII